MPAPACRRARADDLRAARGVALGVALGGLLWCVIALFAWG